MTEFKQTPHRYGLMLLLSCAVLVGCSTTEEPESKESDAVDVVQPVDSSTGANQSTGEVTPVLEAEELLVIDQPGPTPGRLERQAGYRDLASKAVLAESMVAHSHPSSVGMDMMRHPSEPLDREAYTHFDTNPVHLVSESPVSTFSIDVDSASYANVRRLLNQACCPVMTRFGSKS